MQLIHQLKSRITNFDLVIFSIIAALVVAFTLFFYRKSEFVPIRVKVTDQDVLYANTQPQNWYANAFVVGDQELDTLGKPLATITRIERISLDGQKKMVYLDMTVKALYDSRTKQYSLKGKPLNFGTPIRFSFKQVFFDSLVVRTPAQFLHPSPPTTITIQAELKNTYGYIADRLKQSEGKHLTDSQNQDWLTIDTVAVTNADDVYKIIDTPNKDLTFRKEAQYKDVDLTLTVNAQKNADEYYLYEDIPLKIGETFPLSLPNLTVIPRLTGVNQSP